eukprot:14039344-Alexandrium_andersonii.AAC.1
MAVVGGPRVARLAARAPPVSWLGFTDRCAWPLAAALSASTTVLADCVHAVDADPPGPWRGEGPRHACEALRWSS